MFACLPSPEISRTVATGADGVASGKAMKIYIESSTIGQATIIAIAEALAARGISTLDMPVSGGPIWARDGKLTAILSGPPAAREAAAPVLERLAGRVMVVGDRAGLGQVAKVVNNALSLTGMMIACEAIVAGVKAGIRCAHADRCDQCEHRPQFRDSRQVSEGDPAAHIRLWRTDRARQQGSGNVSRAWTRSRRPRPRSDSRVAELWKTITDEIGASAT